MKENLAMAIKQVTTDPIYLGVSEDMNLLDFYLAIPKFYRGDQSKLRINGIFLDPLDREFSFDGKLFRAIITSGRIGENKERIAFYPGEMEEQIEQVIWSLAYDYRQSYPDFVSDTFNFSTNSIQAKLLSRGLHYSIAEIIQAVKVLTRTNIEVQPKAAELKGAWF